MPLANGTEGPDFPVKRLSVPSVADFAIISFYLHTVYLMNVKVRYMYLLTKLDGSPKLLRNEISRK